MNKPSILLASLASAIFFTMGLPNEVFNYGLPALGYIALVPLYFAAANAPSFGFAALSLGLYGAAHHALSSYWLYFFKDFAFWTIGATTLAYGVVYAVFGLYLAFALKKAGPYRPIAFALAWTCFEYLKATGFLGYPWGLLPYTQTEFLPLLQIADTTGIYGLSFVLAFANGAIAELLGPQAQPRPSQLPLAEPCPSAGPSTGRPAYVDADKLCPSAQGESSIDLQDASSPAELCPSGAASGAGLRRRAQAWRHALGVMVGYEGWLRRGYVLVAALLLSICLGYGLFRLEKPPVAVSSLDTVLVQQNADPWILGEEASLEANISLARKALPDGSPPPDLILFSESSLKRPYKEFQRWFSTMPASDPLIPFIKEKGSHLLTGAPVVLDWEELEMTNSVILIDPEARLVGDYAKVHPVPFAEAIPLWEYEWFRTFMREVVGLDSGWVMGSEFKVFRLPARSGEVAFGAPICFEDAFPEVCREFILGGADLLINLTNDAWSETVSAEVQHFAAARFRAIEYRRSLVRSTNGGVSCVVDARGKAIAQLPLFERASLRTDVPIYRGPPTVYLRFGDWFARLCLLLSGISAIILMVRDGRERRRL